MKERKTLKIAALYKRAFEPCFALLNLKIFNSEIAFYDSLNFNSAEKPLETLNFKKPEEALDYLTEESYVLENPNWCLF